MSAEARNTAATNTTTAMTPAIPDGESLSAESTASKAVDEVAEAVEQLSVVKSAGADDANSAPGPESDSSPEESDEDGGGNGEGGHQEEKADAKGKGKAKTVYEGPIHEGGFIYSADPDPKDGTPHPSGLTYEERLAIVKQQVESARSCQRGKYLLSNTHTGDIILKTTSPEKGYDSMHLHREILEKESGWVRERFPPPNEDGSPVTVGMGEWSITIYGQMFLFMYTHHLAICEPDEGNPLDLGYIQANIHMYMLATSWRVARLQEYTLKIVEQAIGTLRGLISEKKSLAYYRLHPTQYEDCETKLRYANTCLCREEYYPDDTRKMLLPLARLNIMVVPWMKKQPYLRPLIEQFWFRMQEYYFPWREVIWRFRHTGLITDDDAPDGWDWLGPELPSEQVEKAVAQFGM